MTVKYAKVKKLSLLLWISDRKSRQNIWQSVTCLSDNGEFPRSCFIINAKLLFILLLFAHGAKLKIY